MSIFSAATMPPPPSSSMKLAIDTGAQRVLFAEAGKDVVDFILGLVTMPLGAVDRLLHPEGGSFGTIANVYASAEKMDAAYLQGTAARNALLDAGVVPAPAKPSLSFSGFVLPGPPPPNTSSNSRTSEPNHALPLYLSRCDACHASRLPRGFVKDMAKYTIMDDLSVTPTTNFSSVALLKSLGVKNLDALEERTVHVGREEAMGILKAALHSKTVLTDVFLKTKTVSNHWNGGNTINHGSSFNITTPFS